MTIGAIWFVPLRSILAGIESGSRLFLYPEVSGIDGLLHVAVSVLLEKRVGRTASTATDLIRQAVGEEVLQVLPPARRTQTSGIVLEAPAFLGIRCSGCADRDGGHCNGDQL
jgi:hypothetical protein